jgi:DNA-directed RNA polymerase subunit alpha
MLFLCLFAMRIIVFIPMGANNEIREVLFLEIWMNGGLTPRETLYEASRILIELFIPFLHGEEQNIDGMNNRK